MMDCMHDLLNFNYQGNQVRTIRIDNEPWWVAKDVCEIFGDSNYRRSIQRLDDDEKGVSPFNTPGGIQNMTIVNEPGLYRLLFRMQPQYKKSMDIGIYEQRVEQLSRFTHWIYEEVLPSIRKTGSYSMKQLSSRELIDRAVIEANRILENETVN